MKLRILGPLGRVTGSGYLLEYNGRYTLVDYGLRQGEGEAGTRWNCAAPDFDLKLLDSVFLTHAHLDHCGNLPLLVRHGWRGKVLCTKETAALAGIVLADTLRRGGTSWSQRDLDRLSFEERGPRVLDHFYPIAQDLWFALHRTGHIPGAVSVQLIWGPRSDQRSIAFSGDIGPAVEGRQTSLLNGHWMSPRGISRRGGAPRATPPLDVLVMESTYGARSRDPVDGTMEARLGHLTGLLRRNREAGGVLVLPCFAVDRTQAVLADLHLLAAREPELFAGVPVYLDAPMASRVNEVYVKALGRRQAFKTKVRPLWLGKPFFEQLGLDRRSPSDLELAEGMVRSMLLGRSGDDPLEGQEQHGSPVVRGWRALVEPDAPSSSLEGPAVLVTGGGMLMGGRVMNHLPHLLRDPRTTLALTGFCAPGTVGRTLAALTELSAGERELLPGGVMLGDIGVCTRDVAARVELLRGYSAHADQGELVEYALPSDRVETRRVAARRILLTHGDDDARRALKQAIESGAEQLASQYPETDFSTLVQIPKDDAAWLDLDEPSAGVEDEMAMLRRELEKLEAWVAREKAG